MSPVSDDATDCISISSSTAISSDVGMPVVRSGWSKYSVIRDERALDEFESLNKFDDKLKVRHSNRCDDDAEEQ